MTMVSPTLYKKEKERFKKNKTLQAIEIIAAGKLALKEVVSRPLRENEIRIEVAYCGVCGSDLKNILNPVQVPQIPGHEFSGKVVEVSDKVSQGIYVNDRVTAFPMMVCMHCKACQNGFYRDCPNKQSLGFQLPGAFAEEIIIDRRLAVKLEDYLSYEEGALIEHLCCGYRLMKEIEADTSDMKNIHIVIIGDGPIALADIQALKSQHYSNITLIGKHKNRTDLAKKLGAIKILHYDSLIRTKNVLSPIDVCILAAEAAEQMLIPIMDLMKPSTVFYPQTRVKTDEVKELLAKKKIKIGKAFAYFIDDFKKVMELIKDKKIKTDILVTRCMPLSQVANEVPSLYEKENNIKILIKNEQFKD